jgi:hypothetical protein
LNTFRAYVGVAHTGNTRSPLDYAAIYATHLGADIEGESMSGYATDIGADLKFESIKVIEVDLKFYLPQRLKQI